MDISFDNLRQAEGILDNLNEIKEKIEQRINLQYKAADEKRVVLTGNKIMRICLIVGLYQTGQRDLNCLSEIQLSKSSIRIPSSFSLISFKLSIMPSACLRLSNEISIALPYYLYRGIPKYPSSTLVFCSSTLRWSV